MTKEGLAPDAYAPDIWLRRLARISAWMLLAGIIVLLVSGWGITQTGVIYNASFGLIDRRLANAIHRASNVPLAIFFLTHVTLNIKLAMMRSRPSWGVVTNIVLIVLGLGVLAIVVYMEYFRLGG